jgi:hypothetical protein
MLPDDDEKSVVDTSRRRKIEAREKTGLPASIDTTVVGSRSRNTWDGDASDEETVTADRPKSSRGQTMSDELTVQASTVLPR